MAKRSFPSAIRSRHRIDIQSDVVFKPFHSKLCYSNCDFYEKNQEMVAFAGREPSRDVSLKPDDFSHFLGQNTRRELCLGLKGGVYGARVGRRLKSENMAFLGGYLSCLEWLIVLDLSYNEIGDEGLIHLKTALKTCCPSLKDLNLYCNDFCGFGMQELTDAVLRYHNLRRYVLGANKIGNNGGKILSSQLVMADPERVPVELDIGETDLGMEGLLHLANAVLRLHNLKFLNLSRLILRGPQETMAAVEKLAMLLKCQPNIVGLRLQKCSLGDKEIENLLRDVHPNSGLSLLDLTGNDMHSQSAAILSSFVVKYPRIRVLLLARNKLGEKGVRHLSYVIPKSRLEVLDLSYNGISSVGLCFLSYSLSNSRIQHLFLWGNHFDHNAGVCFERLFDREVLNDERTDFTVYEVDGVKMTAYQDRSRARDEYNHYFE